MSDLPPLNEKELETYKAEVAIIRVLIFEARSLSTIDALTEHLKRWEVFWMHGFAHMFLASRVPELPQRLLGSPGEAGYVEFKFTKSTRRGENVLLQEVAAETIVLTCQTWREEPLRMLQEMVDREERATGRHAAEGSRSDASKVEAESGACEAGGEGGARLGIEIKEGKKEEGNEG